ncbi:MAG: 2'-5' RNA ligase family protein [Sphingomonas sp.]|uniref:2'-5' RNA ligase family protein n=1 Tax=Sphingomonas sp. TaxID=28214 RepID=UPI003F7FE412
MLLQKLHRLFFAIKPALHVVPTIEATRRLYCPGRPVRGEHLHVTMEIFDDHIGMPERLVERLIAVGNDIDMPGFLLSMGRVVGTTQSVALRPSGRSTGLSLLQRAIRERVADAGLSSREGWTFNPHMTLGYHAGAAFARAIDPIKWQVEELVLVLSHVGETRHDIVSRWELAPELPLFQ